MPLVVSCVKLAQVYKKQKSRKGEIMFDDMQAIVLAAGKATRFKGNTTKLIEKICGQELILYITKTLESLNILTTLVVGYQKEAIISLVAQHHGTSAITFAFQKAQHGTGDALACSRPFWQKDHLLVLNGDIPLLPTADITLLYEQHKKQTLS